MNKKLVAKFARFSDAELWVMVVCFKSPQQTLLYQHALTALDQSNPEMAQQLRERRERAQARKALA